MVLLSAAAPTPVAAQAPATRPAPLPVPGWTVPPGPTLGLAIALVLTSACGGLSVPDPLPRVIATAPTAPVSPDEVKVSIAFSAPLAPEGVAEGRWVGLCRREDLRAVVAQAEAEAGLPGGAPLLPASASLSADGTRVEVVPAGPLAPDTLFAAVLSRRARSADGRPILDADGKARTVAVLFETGPAPDRTPPAPRWLTPPHGPVPRDLTALEVGFDEPVAGALALAPAPGAPAAALPAARAVTASPQRLGLVLQGALAGGPLALDLAGVHDEAGNAPAALDPLEVSPCSSAGPPALLERASAAGELFVDLSATTAGMGRLTAELQAGPGEPACGAAPAAPGVAQLRGEVSACPGFDPCRPTAAACPATLRLGGLCPGRAVRVRLATEDLAWRRAPFGAWLEVAALPPRAQPVLTEALADADAPEAGGEYVEVANVGTGEVDLAGHTLAKRGASGGFSRCVLEPAPGGAVSPGGIALVVGGAYDGRYALPAEVRVYSCGASALAGGLANDRPVALALESPQGATLSTLGIAEAAPRCPDGALERIDPAGPDAAAGLACPGTRSPGACNSVTAPERCPKRGW